MRFSFWLNVKSCWNYFGALGMGDLADSFIPQKIRYFDGINQNLEQSTFDSCAVPDFSRPLQVCLENTRRKERKKHL